MFKHNNSGPGFRGRGLPRFFWPATFLTVTALLLLMPSQSSSAHAVPISAAETTAKPTAVKEAAYQVPVTLYVMSQCPGESREVGRLVAAHWHWPVAVLLVSQAAASSLCHDPQ